MTEVKLVGEDIDIEAGFRVKVEVAGAFRGDLDAFVGNIPLPDEEFADFLILAFQAGKIHVGQHTGHIVKQVQVVWTLNSIGDRAEYSR